MTVRSKHLKLAGAAGAAALTVSSLAVASPALAAGKTMTFSCVTSPLGSHQRDAHAGEHSAPR